MFHFNIIESYQQRLRSFVVHVPVNGFAVIEDNSMKLKKKITYQTINSSYVHL